jgi:glutamyl-tRNA synthetase
MVNFLALLGWSPGGDRELLTAEELTSLFSLEAISGGNAVFDTAKLEWMNGQYIAAMDDRALLARVAPVLEGAGLWPSGWRPADDAAAEGGRDQMWLTRLLTLLKPRAKRLTDFVDQGRAFLVDEVEFDEDAVAKHLTGGGAGDVLDQVADGLRAAEPFDEPTVEAVVRGTAERLGMKAGALMHPVRVAMVGRTASPGLFEVIVLLGRERVLARLHRAAVLARAR